LKLLTKSTYYFLLFSSLAMIAGAVLLYFTIRRIVYKQIDNSLITEMEIIQDQIEQTDTIPDFAVSFGHQIEVRLLDNPLHKFQVINDTIVSDTISSDNLPFRCLYYAGKTNRNKGYTIRILQTLSEKKELLEDISLYLFFLFLSLFLISILLNYLISIKLWNPFYVVVDKAEKFDIQSDKPIELPETSIKEFRQLNTVFNKMTRKMRNDYLSLKEYNENAAHEIQTPLAIIRSKLEILMQRKELKKESINLIESINEATTRLFKLNQGLLLISKIDNFYFQEGKEISLKQIIGNSIIHYKEIMQLKKITVEMEANDPAIVKMNEILAEVLISNLISNAVRYNIDRGYIKCLINNRYLTISNSGVPLKTDPELLFRRFHKTSENPQSVGLGLSIVKKIADTYKMKITYTCTGNIHELRLEYNLE
jgi:signal transduction histidine kinase